jgi:3-keto-disaccharide hydrolase
MKAIQLMGGALLAASVLSAQHNQLTPDERKQGWILLFDGSTFQGWEDPVKKSTDSFVIENGCLKSKGHPKYQEDLFSEQQFGDFELVFDWRVSEGGNSGVKYRIQDRIWVQERKGSKFEDQVAYSYAHRSDRRPDRGQQYVVGFEYQCIDDERHPDGRRGGSHASGALYDFLAPVKHAAKTVGEFNHARIVVNGSHVEHWLNGVQVVDGDLRAPAIAESAAKRWGAGSKVAELLTNRPVKECRISLQNHNDEAWFRDIKIRRLK